MVQFAQKNQRNQRYEIRHAEKDWLLIMGTIGEDYLRVLMGPHYDSSPKCNGSKVIDGKDSVIGTFDGKPVYVRLNDVGDRSPAFKRALSGVLAGHELTQPELQELAGEAITIMEKNA